jgi:hypothetical protein
VAKVGACGAEVFCSREGYVVAVAMSRALPGKVKIGDFEPKAALISSVDFTHRTNQQFQQSLDGAIYVYVFGDLMGEVVIEGRTFAAMCSGAGGDQAVSGLREILDFYAKNRAALRPEPIQVTIGDEPIVGFLTNIRVRSQALAEDPTALYHSFTLVVNTLPTKSTSNSAG